jgi:hypothetical protein
MTDSSPDIRSGHSQSDDERRNRARRHILRTLVVGGGAMTAARATPETWVKPVVESIILPGHAATSAPVAPGNPSGTFSSGTVSLTEASPPADTLLADAAPESKAISDELLEFFMPSANAANELPCNASCDVEFNAEVQNYASYICVSGDVKDVIRATVLPGSPPRMTKAESSFFYLNSGEFRNGKWHLSLQYRNSMGNVVTDVRMSPGGVGCGIR